MRYFVVVPTVSLTRFPSPSYTMLIAPYVFIRFSKS